MRLTEKSVFPRDKVGRNYTSVQEPHHYNKGSYRPVSVLFLPCISKLFEGVLMDELQCHFNPLVFDHMSGFRKGDSCQCVLTNFIETSMAKFDSKPKNMFLFFRLFG